MSGYYDATCRKCTKCVMAYVEGLTELAAVVGVAHAHAALTDAAAATHAAVGALADVVTRRTLARLALPVRVTLARTALANTT